MTTLLVANDGGHIMQLHTLRRRLEIDGDPIWVTPRTPQTESLLAGEDVFWTDPCPTRDVRAIVHNARLTRPLVRRADVRLAVSTGAALALAVLPQTRLRGIQTVYIESATRLDSPSLSGSLLARIPGIDTYCQSRAMATGKWRYLASPWDLYVTHDVASPQAISKVVVSLGTSDRYGFRRLLERLVPLIPPDATVLWQTGSTDCTGLEIAARPSVPAAELQDAMREADVVVAHAGTGVALAALEAGKYPVLVPRRAAYGEHVDDHQTGIARELGGRGLAVVRQADEISEDDLIAATTKRVERVPESPALRIRTSPPA